MRSKQWKRRAREALPSDSSSTIPMTGPGNQQTATGSGAQGIDVIFPPLPGTTDTVPMDQDDASKVNTAGSSKRTFAGVLTGQKTGETKTDHRSTCPFGMPFTVSNPAPPAPFAGSSHMLPPSPVAQAQSGSDANIDGQTPQAKRKATQQKGKTKAARRDGTGQTMTSAETTFWLGPDRPFWVILFHNRKQEDPMLMIQRK